MSKAVGIDIVEFTELSPKMNDRFIKRILSDNELEIFNKITNEQRKLSFLAGRFAAKEAYTKVYKKFSRPLNFRDVDIQYDIHGAPFIVSPYQPNDVLHLSISHSKNYAIAICILE